MCEKGLRKHGCSAVCLSPSAGSKPAMNRGGEMNKILFSPTIHPCPPGWVQAWCRHFRGRPEECSTDPPCFSHSGHRLQQAGQRPEAENLRLEGVSAAGPVSTLFFSQSQQMIHCIKTSQFYTCRNILLLLFVVILQHCLNILKQLNCNSC